VGHVVLWVVVWLSCGLSCGSCCVVGCVVSWLALCSGVDSKPNKTDPPSNKNTFKEKDNILPPALLLLPLSSPFQPDRQEERPNLNCQKAGHQWGGVICICIGLQGPWHQGRAATTSCSEISCR